MTGNPDSAGVELVIIDGEPLAIKPLKVGRCSPSCGRSRR